MLNSIVQFFSLLSGQLQVPLAGVLLTVGIWTSEAKPVLSNELKPPATSAASIAPTRKLQELDGIYLYGQSPEPEQIGQDYMVFEVRQGKVIGAVYMPRSEFSCFYGTLQSGKLAVMVADNPDSHPYPNPIAAQNSQQVATASNIPPVGNGYNPIAYPYSVALQNYHRLASVSANDRRILRTCKNNYQKESGVKIQSPVVP